MPFSFPFLSFLLLASASPATGSGMVLSAGLPFFQKGIAVLQREGEQQAQEAWEQEATEMFPLSATGAQRASQFSDYVTVYWRNAPFDLKDVPRNLWFAPYVRDMASLGIVTGYTDAVGKPLGEFGPHRPVSIEEMVKMVMAAAGVDPSSCSEEPKNAMAKESWSAPYFSCAEERKLSLTTDSSLDVTRPALRGEVVLTLLEAFGVIKPSSGSIAIVVAAGTGAAAGTTTQTGSVFVDVLPGMFTTEAIRRAAGDGIISGYKDHQGVPTGYFGPEKQITRAEVSKVLSLAIQVYGMKKERD
ncbi:MAG: S-layer homology domain-containing protein [Patescibacteria group bacterium]